VLREVAVGIHAVVGRDLAVAVVVAQVLAPQPILVEGVLVPVRVRDDEEPELRSLKQPPDLPVAGLPAVDEVVQEAAVHLDGDPLPRVLERRVQHRRPRAVPLAAGVIRHLQRDQLPALVRLAENFELDQAGVLPSYAVQLVPNSSRFIPRSPNVEAPDRLCGSLRAHRPASPVALQPQLDAGRSQLGALGIGENDIGSNATPRVPHAGGLEALCGAGDLARVARDRVHLELLTPLAGGRGRGRQGDHASECG
jgi:hypothetical protein